MRVEYFFFIVQINEEVSHGIEHVDTENTSKFKQQFT